MVVLDMCAKTCLLLTLQVAQGSTILSLETESTLSLVDFWDEEEEEKIFNHTTGAREPIMAEDPSPTMEAIFGDLHPEGQQTNQPLQKLSREREREFVRR